MQSGENKKLCVLCRDHLALLIDNCASGGHRIDFEMLRRSVVLWRSDCCWDAIALACELSVIFKKLNYLSILKFTFQTSEVLETSEV